MTRRPAAANERLVTIPVYDPDRNGAALFAAVSNNIAGGLNHARAVISTTSTTWHGWTKQPQQFRGAAGLGRARPAVQREGGISGQRSAAAPSTAMQIFGEQMRRQG